MKRKQYLDIENFMISCMKDSVHDELHIYRVVNYAAQISDEMADADFDIMIVAALLHDIGRIDEQRDSSVCHAEIGSEKAKRFLLSMGYDEAFSERVANCILTHRHKSGKIPESIEAKIVFDSDKLDLIGNVGAARAILFGGQINEPIYTLDENKFPKAGFLQDEPSLFREYQKKLRSLSDKLYTDAAKNLAKKQQQTMNDYFNSLIQEVNQNHQQGRKILEKHFY